MGVPRRFWPVLRSLMLDQDAEVSVIARQICSASSSAEDAHPAILRPNMPIHNVGWMLRAEIERLLSTHQQRAGGRRNLCLRREILVFPHRKSILTGTNLNDFNGRPQTTNLGPMVGSGDIGGRKLP